MKGIEYMMTLEEQMKTCGATDKDWAYWKGMIEKDKMWLDFFEGAFEDGDLPNYIHKRLAPVDIAFIKFLVCSPSKAKIDLAMEAIENVCGKDLVDNWKKEEKKKEIKH